jgi:hypothetical protein
MPSLPSEWLETRNSPYINRFLSPDSIIPDLSNPQGWNRYSYVTNRPVNFNDPSGHMLTCGSAGEGGCGGTTPPPPPDDPDDDLKEDSHKSGSFNNTDLTATLTFGPNQYTLGCDQYWINPDGSHGQWGCTEVNTYRLYDLQDDYLDYLSYQENTPYSEKDFGVDFLKFSVGKMVGLAGDPGVTSILMFVGNVINKPEANQAAALDYAIDRTYSREYTESGNPIDLIFYDEVFNSKGKAVSVVVTSRYNEVYVTEVNVPVSLKFQEWLVQNVP